MSAHQLLVFAGAGTDHLPDVEKECGNARLGEYHRATKCPSRDEESGGGYHLDWRAGPVCILLMLQPSVLFFTCHHHLWREDLLKGLYLLYHRWACSMKKAWGKHIAVTPAKGLSPSTAAPGSKLAMQPATLPGQEIDGGSDVIQSSKLCSVICKDDLLIPWFVSPDIFVSPCSAPMDTNLLSNIHKLFSERIDIFSSVEFNKVRSSTYCSLPALKMDQSHSVPLSPGLCYDRNYQNQFKDFLGVCPAAHLWPLWASADPGRLSLPADVPVALCLWWEPCALPTRWDNGQLRPPLLRSCSNGAKCDWSHLWERLKIKVQQDWNCHIQIDLVELPMMP